MSQEKFILKWWDDKYKCYQRGVPSTYERVKTTLDAMQKLFPLAGFFLEPFRDEDTEEMVGELEKCLQNS